ncbi:hypothetical protein BOTBODRAFT_173126 [Botryobasidium botryosum FD-172 SS1]|uniref:Cytochrome c oxidase subunit IV n=1 Tax=Botryobasidium botryosum (strain FD-172 SS1) TaxID=930990 RepID=A0A067MKY0_BOTB1|nr:hypothetical protein BOTBODRAFT_173126 [Botryobasidium botryosum FD-172 SS1]
MNSLRLAPRVLRAPAPLRHASTITASTSTTAAPSSIPLSNVEAQWKHLSSEEQLDVHRQLEVLQKKDWKELSADEKRAAYYVAFGPHGPRAPDPTSGSALQIVLGTVGLVAVGGLVFGLVRSAAPPPPKTITKEWQEAATERGREQKLNPITGLSSEGYKGTGFVTEK